jgi:hypothetical protein
LTGTGSASGIATRHFGASVACNEVVWPIQHTPSSRSESVEVGHDIVREHVASLEPEAADRVHVETSADADLYRLLGS